MEGCGKAQYSPSGALTGAFQGSHSPEDIAGKDEFQLI